MNTCGVFRSPGTSCDTLVRSRVISRSVGEYVHVRTLASDHSRLRQERNAAHTARFREEYFYAARSAVQEQRCRIVPRREIIGTLVHPLAMPRWDLAQP